MKYKANYNMHLLNKEMNKDETFTLNEEQVLLFKNLITSKAIEETVEDDIVIKQEEKKKNAKK